MTDCKSMIDAFKSGGCLHSSPYIGCPYIGCPYIGCPYAHAHMYTPICTCPYAHAHMHAGGCFHSRTAMGMFDHVKAAVDTGEVPLDSRASPTCYFHLDTSYFILHTAHCTLYTSHFTLHTSHFTLLIRCFSSGTTRKAPLPLPCSRTSTAQNDEGQRPSTSL